MKVGIDITHLLWKYRTGVQNYYHGLIDNLADCADENDDMEFLLVDRNCEEVQQFPFRATRQIKFQRAIPYSGIPTFRNIGEKHFLRRGMHSWNYRVNKFRGRTAHHRAEQLLDDLDVFQVWNWNIKRAPRARHVITVPDIIPLRMPELFPTDFIDATKQSLDFARDEADAVIAISEFTKQDLVETIGIAPEKIDVVYCGVHDIFRPVSDAAGFEQMRQTYGIGDAPYILSVGFLDPRKNVKGHVRAFERLASRSDFADYQLILVGPESLATNDVLQEIKFSSVRQRIHVTGYVPNEHLVQLLNFASVFVYCSFYEGFGIPVVEAMACGAPVVTSNTTSLAEIGQGAALLVDPNSPDEIAEAVAKILSDNLLSGKLRSLGLEHARQFTWKKFAEGHVRVWRECAAG